MNLGAKVKVNSSSGVARLLAKEVGARGCFQFAPTPVDKCAKSLIYKAGARGTRGTSKEGERYIKYLPFGIPLLPL